MRDPGTLWGVTSFFNPCRYRARYRNFLAFRAQLGVPLVAVELSFDGEFELRPGDADVVVRVADGDVLWQKERLLNLAVRAAPEHCSAVVALDCDVVFDNPHWPRETESLLRRHPVVQPFTRACQLPAGVTRPDAAAWDEGNGLYGVAFAKRRELDYSDGTSWPVYGGGWAFRRPLLERHGLYEACVVGGGDQALGCALFGDYPEAIGPSHMNAEQEAHYLRWAEPLYREVRGDVGFVEGRLGTLWHGEAKERKYISRHQGLAPFAFAPDRDLRPGTDGAWRWASDKPAMHHYVREYFASRNEDGAG
jgi:hypothetical protein